MRYRLVWAIYRDVMRGHLTNPHCACEDDLRMTRHAHRLRQALESLGPTFIKLGQFLSRRPDLVPPVYVQVLTELQEKTPAVPFATARRRLEEVCICSRRAGKHEPKPTCLHCRRLEGVFTAFDPEPVASASLAQVHRAVYGGRQVAVKFLKPGVLDRLSVDLALLERLRWLISRVLGVDRNIPAAELIGEFRRRLLEEVNFEYEALNIARFRDSHPDTGPVRAPAVYWEFERADLLVLEFIDGASLRTWHGTPEERRRLAQTIGKDFARQVCIDNFFHADPHPGNLFVEPNGRMVYLDFGAVGQLDRTARRAVLRLLRAILENDPELAVSAVLEVGQTDPAAVDIEELRADVDRIIQLYRRRGGAQWTDAVVQTARRHRIRLPRSIVLYAKAIMLNEALVNELDPGFEILPVVRRLVIPIIERELADLGTQLEHELPAVARAYAELVHDLPDMLRQWFKRGRAAPG
jgi:ubiquinone biosynthesis protein